MEAEGFKLIRERKKVMGMDWNEVALRINQENGTNVDGDQVRQFVQQGNVPFGGWLYDALEYALEIPRRHPKSKIAFKGGGGENE